MAVRSSAATGASGQEPNPERTVLMSKPTSCILWIPVSTMRAATCTEPTVQAVGAISRCSLSGLTPHFPAIRSVTAGGGSVRDSSVSTATSAGSR